MWRFHPTIFALFFLLLFGSGCGKQSDAPASPGHSNSVSELQIPKIEDVTARVGIHWVHNPGRSGKKYLPETVGGGGGFIDYNNDGLPDILLINSGGMPGYKGDKPRHALYRNNGDGTFTDVTTEAGLNTLPDEYGIGVAIGDFDNDGWQDIFVTGVGHTRLLHNVHGRFVDVTKKAGVDVDGFTTAATWIDYDRDGHLDLFVARYVAWSPQTDLPCGATDARQYCAPYQYTGAPPVLFHNNGDGTFTDVSVSSGVLGHSMKTLSVSPYDFNHDGWIDLFIANDTEPDVLLINQKDGTFKDVALPSGIALGTDGNATGSMGTDVATPFNDDRTGVAVGVFAGQRLSLFVDTPRADSLLLFENRNEEAQVAQPTAPMTTFGLVYADVNMDGFTDLLVLNGHIDDDPALMVGGARVPYRQSPQMLLNRGDGAFQDVAAAAGIGTPLIGRGLAVGDYDNDGSPDFLAFENGGSVHLWHNQTPHKHSWLGINLRGTKSPRDGTGAFVTIVGEGWKQSRLVTTTRSYLSACDPRLLFGIPTGSVKQIIVRWSSGTTSTVSTPPLNRYRTVVEPG